MTEVPAHKPTHTVTTTIEKLSRGILKTSDSWWGSVWEGFYFREPGVVDELRIAARSSNFVDEELRKQLDSALANEYALVFVIGEWGVGKTHQILSFFKSDFWRGRLMVYRSFFGIHTLDESYAHLSTIPERVFAPLVAACLVGVGIYKSHNVRSTNEYLGIVGTLVSIVFFLNRSRLRYVVSRSWVSAFSIFRRIVVIDDIDRSSLTEGDRWALLTALWRYRHQYIVPVGFKSFEDQLGLLEIAKKLGARAIVLEAGVDEKMKLGLKHKELFPFKDIPKQRNHWLNCFPTRELLAAITTLEEETSQSPDEMKPFLAAHYFYRCLLRQLGINRYEEKEIHFPGANGHLRIAYRDSQQNDPVVTTNQEYFHTFQISLSTDVESKFREWATLQDSANVRAFEGLFRTRSVSDCQKAMHQYFEPPKKKKGSQSPT